jgi:hypothetical protein
MDGAGGKEGKGAAQDKGAFEHILRGYPVADVGDLRRGTDAPDDAFHDSDKAVRQSKIGRQGDDCHQRFHRYCIAARSNLEQVKEGKNQATPIDISRIENIYEKILWL